MIICYCTSNHDRQLLLPRDFPPVRLKRIACKNSKKK